MSRAKIGVRVTKDDTAKVFATIARFPKKKVVIGVPESENQRAQNADGDYLNEIGNAALYYINDNGSAAANVPQRETLRPGIEDAREELAGILGQAAVQAFVDPSAIDRGLEAAGVKAVTSVKKRIVSSTDLLELADSTIAERKRHGIESEKPLIRTASMLGAITSEVRDR